MKRIFFLALIALFTVSCDQLPFADMDRDPIEWDRDGSGSGNSDDDRDDKDGDNDRDDKKGEPCFMVIGPFSYTMPDGSIIEAESQREAEMLIDMWFAENGRAFDSKPIRNFPITIVYDDGTEVVINSQEELREAKRDCYGNRDDRWDRDEDDDEGDDDEGDDDEGDDDEGDDDEGDDDEGDDDENENSGRG